MTRTDLGLNFRTEASRHHLRPESAAALLGIGYCTPGTRMGSTTVEDNLRKHGMIRTNALWNGCVDRTERGDQVARLLALAGEVDHLVEIGDDYTARTIRDELADAQQQFAAQGS
jgi:hypothetical protein